MKLTAIQVLTKALEAYRKLENFIQDNWNDFKAIEKYAAQNNIDAGLCAWVRDNINDPHDGKLGLPPGWIATIFSSCQTSDDALGATRKRIKWLQNRIAILEEAQRDREEYNSRSGYPGTDRVPVIQGTWNVDDIPNEVIYKGVRYNRAPEGKFIDRIAAANEKMADQRQAIKQLNDDNNNLATQIIHLEKQLSSLETEKACFRKENEQFIERLAALEREKLNGFFQSAPLSFKKWLREGGYRLIKGTEMYCRMGSNPSNGDKGQLFHKSFLFKSWNDQTKPSCS